MGRVTEISQNKRLKEYGINIKTRYRTEDGIRERNTDLSRNDNIEHGIRIEKRYYRNGAVIHRNRNFDSRILYSFVTEKGDSDVFVCPNCGGVCAAKDVEEGCPYCGTFLNLDYTHRDLGTKYTYDRTLKNKYYIPVTLGIDFLFSVFLSWIYISATGRTFNGYDVAKVFIYGAVLCAALFYLFYYMDALVILGPVKRYKDRINRQQADFWKRMEEKGIKKEKFYNNFNFEISQYYFKECEDIIDYDIVDYNRLEEFYENQKLYVRVNASIRLVRYHKESGKIKDRIVKKDYVLEYQGPSRVALNGEVSKICCRNCGSSIDITAERCPYCNTEYRSVQEWFLKTEC